MVVIPPLFTSPGVLAWSALKGRVWVNSGKLA